MREHLRACAHCRATVRTYRAAPRIAGALLPALPASRSLLERAQELAGSLWARLPSGGGETAAQVAAAGGSRGAGMAALAKLLTVCAGAAGGAACVATGVVPTPLALEHDSKPAVARPADQRTTQSGAIDYEPAPSPTPEEIIPTQAEKPHETHERPKAGTAYEPETSEATAGAIEYEPPPPPVEPVAPPTRESAPSGSATGEFGP